DCPAAWRRHSPHRALLLVARHGGGLGRVRRAAGGRDGAVFVRHNAPRHAGRHHAVGHVAGRGHRYPLVRMDPRAVDRLHPGTHARAAAARRSRRRSLPGLAGPGVGLWNRPARDPPAARVRRAQAAGQVRHPRVSRPCVGERRRPVATLARQHRAMGRRLALALALLPACLQAQREGVLKQVDLPPPYYWREMYVPQVTSGPSSATWSPDGTELIYSMQGSLWRQRIGSRVAQQLTAGEGYDYQPDWSPDGRLVVFARYTHDAIELQLLDLAAKTVQPVTANGAVNVEPRWSPDGTRIAFVSSAYNRRWHIFTVAIAGGTPAEGTVTRLTEDNDSRLPRYYYSVWDHYLSPTWSPDGRELIIVSNRG